MDLDDLFVVGGEVIPEKNEAKNSFLSIHEHVASQPSVLTMTMPLALSSFRFEEKETRMLLVHGIVAPTSPGLLATGAQDSQVYAYPALKLEGDKVVSSAAPVYYGYDRIPFEGRAFQRKLTLKTVPALNVKTKDGKTTAYNADVERKNVADWGEKGPVPTQVGTDKLPLALLQPQADVFFQVTPASLESGLARPEEAHALRALPKYNLALVEQQADTQPSIPFSRYALPIGVKGGVKIEEVVTTNLPSGAVKFAITLAYKGHTESVAAWEATIASAFGEGGSRVQTKRMKEGGGVWYIDARPGGYGGEYALAAVTPFYNVDKGTSLRLTSTAVQSKLTAILGGVQSPPPASDKAKAAMAAELARRLEFVKTVGPLPLHMVKSVFSSERMEVALDVRTMFGKLAAQEPVEDMVALLREYDGACAAAEADEFGYTSLPEMPERLARIFETLERDANGPAFTNLIAFAARKSDDDDDDDAEPSDGDTFTPPETLVEYVDADGLNRTIAELERVVEQQSPSERAPSSLHGSTQKPNEAWYLEFAKALKASLAPPVDASTLGLEGFDGVLVSTLKVAYEQNFGGGRRYAQGLSRGPEWEDPVNGRRSASALCAQGCPNVLKPALYGRFYHDLDMVSAHPTIFLALGAQLDVEAPKLADYVAHREAWIERLGAHFELPGDPTTVKDQVKNLVTRLLYGGKLKTWLRDTQLPEAASHPDVSALVGEVERIWAAVLAAEPWKTKAAALRVHLKQRATNPREGDDATRTIQSRILQEIENELLRGVQKAAKDQGATIGALIYDGVMVQHMPSLDVAALIQASEKAMSELLAMKLVEKPLFATGEPKKGGKRAGEPSAGTKAKAVKTDIASRSDDDSTFTVAPSPSPPTSASVDNVVWEEDD